MNWSLVNLFLMVFWLCIGLGTLFREQLFPGEFDPERKVALDMFGYVALLMAGWNLVRWWSQRSAIRSRELWQQRQQQSRLIREDDERPDKPIVNPEFDFDSPPSDSPPADDSR